MRKRMLPPGPPWTPPPEVQVVQQRPPARVVERGRAPPARTPGAQAQRARARLARAAPAALLRPRDPPEARRHRPAAEVDAAAATAERRAGEPRSSCCPRSSYWPA